MRAQLRFAKSPYPVNLTVAGNGFLMPDGDLIDGAIFRRLRDSDGINIATDDLALVCKVLCVPEDEPGIVKL